MLGKTSIVEGLEAIKTATKASITYDSVEKIDIIFPSLEHIYILDYMSGILTIELESIFQSENYICLKHKYENIHIVIDLDNQSNVLGTSIRSGIISVLYSHRQQEQTKKIVNSIYNKISLHKNQILITAGILPYCTIAPFGLSLSFADAIPINAVEMNYNNEIIDSYNNIIKMASLGFADTGKLIIMHGVPGTGKTVLSMAIANSLYSCGYLLVKAAGANSLLAEYDSLITSHNKLIFLIDDSADFVQKTAASNKLLDIVSDSCKNDNLFICTFNTLTRDVHPAMVRDGRLLDVIKTDYLSESQVVDIVHNIYGNNITAVNNIGDKVTISSIYAAKRVDDLAIIDDKCINLDFDRTSRLNTIKQLNRN